MSCGGANQNFRLLDGYVGWDKAHCAGLAGLGRDDAEGLRLAQQPPRGGHAYCVSGDEFVPAGDVLAYLPPPRLARGCGGCDWFLVHRNRLLRRDCCAPVWRPVWGAACDPRLLKRAVAVASRGHLVAVSDAEARRVWIWSGEGQRLAGSINADNLTGGEECVRPAHGNRIERLGPLAFTPWGELLVVDAGANSIRRFGPTGEVRGKLAIALPADAAMQGIENLAASDDCSIWLVTDEGEDALKLWAAKRGDEEFKEASVEELRKSFRPTGLTAADEEKGFCIEQCGPEGIRVPLCFKWNGEPAEEPIEPPAPPKLFERGQLLTRAIDSGIPRCRWHRVRVDADIPSGTSLEIAVATGEPDAGGTEPRAQGDKAQEKGWEEFEAGTPHRLDWQVAPAGAPDFLVRQPPGRLLYVRLRLKGNQKASPVVRRVRLDFPRSTSLEHLPAVYRDNPEAEDFTERFLSIFDASIGDLDRAIERSPALLDPEGVPDEVLPWLGGFLDLVFDPAWEPELRRNVLRALPELYRRRGTIRGLAETVKLVFGVTPVIQELAAERDWGSVAKRGGAVPLNPARLGEVRLFGKSRARFRLDTSALGRAPLRSHGNPDDDVILAQAFRLRVLIPPLSLSGPEAQRRLEQLVASQKPAHTVATIRVGGEGFILGDRSAVGVDTILGAMPPPVLGRSGNVRLRRTSVLWHGKQGRRSGVRLGKTSVVGVNTLAV